MENATDSRVVSAGWKIAIFFPLAAAAVLLLMAGWHHPRLGLVVVANLFIAFAIAIQGMYYISSTKARVRGIAAIVIGSALLGFGLHTLLRLF